MPSDHERCLPKPRALTANCWAVEQPVSRALGRIVPGALADILVADGTPHATWIFLGDPANNLRLIMKDGKVYKNTLGATTAESFY